MKALLSIFVFIFLVIVLILLLTGGFIIRTIRKLRDTAQQMADQQEFRVRQETGRQRRQYRTHDAQGTRKSHTTHKTHTGNETEETTRYTSTATGETIIDQNHQERENRKIFNDSDGEYTDFVEVKGEE